MESYQLRHAGSDRLLGDERGPLLFATAAEAVAFGARFACEPAAFLAERCGAEVVSAA